MSARAIYYNAFVSGAAVMALEILGLGVLAPYFGTALSVSTNMIGVTLVSLALGYHLGGLWADHGEPRALAPYVTKGYAVPALLMVTVGWLGLVLPWRSLIANSIGLLIPSNALGSLVAASALFAFPSITLGMVLPYLIKQYAKDIATSGKTTGSLYRLSTLGSIVGVLVVGMWVLPRFHFALTLALIVAALTLGALLYNPRRYQALGLGLGAILLLVGTTPPDFLQHKNPVFADGRITSDKAKWEKLADETSIFSRLQVYQGTENTSGKPLRFLAVNGEVHSGTYLDSNDLVFNYARFNRLGGHFNPAAKTALLIGGGGYSYANYFLTDTPLYDREKVWYLEGKHYHNNKTVAVPLLLSSDMTRLSNRANLVYVATTTPAGRAAIEGTQNKIVADNQVPAETILIRQADIFETGFASSTGYVHIHETKDDGTPGRVVSSDIPVGDSTMMRPRSIIGDSALISGKNTNVAVPLTRAPKEGEVVYAMLHRDNGNEKIDPLLVDGYEQIESLDVVEIDPRTTRLAEQFFHLNVHDPRFHNYTQDGRTYLNATQKKYDIVYVDAFQSFYSIPWQLTTREAVAQIARVLNQNGVVVVNVPAALSGAYSRFFQAEYKTYASVFPEVRAYAVISSMQVERVQNIIMVAFKNRETIRTTHNDDDEINDQLSHRWFGTLDPSTPLLTDDYAPVDYFINLFGDLR